MFPFARVIATKDSRRKAAFAFGDPMALRMLDNRLATQPHRTLKTAFVPRLRGSSGVRDRQEVLRSAMGLCVACGRIATEVDHIVPLCDGGGDTSDNKQALCHACHVSKTTDEAKRRGGGGSIL